MPTAQEIAKRLGISKEEALQVIADDMAIDKGEKLFELTQEQKQAEKKMRSAGVRRKPVVPPSGPPPRKEDPDKRFLIDGLGDWLHFHECENVIATNPERQIEFDFHGRRFRLVLSAPRK